MEWGGSVILVRHNFSIIPPAEHNFEHNTLVSLVTPESTILNFSSIIRQTLKKVPPRNPWGEKRALLRAILFSSRLIYGQARRANKRKRPQILARSMSNLNRIYYKILDRDWFSTRLFVT